MVKYLPGENSDQSKISRIVPFARGESKSRSDILNTVRSRMNSDGVESMNTSFQRIVSEACSLLDIEYLFAKLREHLLLNRRIHHQKLMRGLNIGVKTVS